MFHVRRICYASKRVVVSKLRMQSEFIQNTALSIYKKIQSVILKIVKIFKTQPLVFRVISLKFYFN